jgi:hypothetical protein
MEPYMKIRLRILLAGTFFAMSQTIAAAELDGTWLMDIKMRSETAHSTFALVQDGEELTGNYRGQFGEAGVSGTVKGSVIAFGYKVEMQGVPVEVTYLGTLEGGVMQGTVTIVGFGDGIFVGTKQH